MHRHVLAAAALLLTTSCANEMGGLSPISATSHVPDQLGVGDEVKIQAYGFDQMTNSYVISDAGTISLPMISTVPAAGKTPAELEATIAGVLRDRDLAPNARVSVQAARLRPYYILGQVQKPGAYPYERDMTLTKAVAIAGGYTFRANTKRAVLTRNQGGRVVRGAAGRDTAVMPGDTIEVPEAWF